MIDQYERGGYPSLKLLDKGVREFDRVTFLDGQIVDVLAEYWPRDTTDDQRRRLAIQAAIQARAAACPGTKELLALFSDASALAWRCRHMVDRILAADIGAIDFWRVIRDEPQGVNGFTKKPVPSVPVQVEELAKGLRKFANLIDRKRDILDSRRVVHAFTKYATVQGAGKLWHKIDGEPYLAAITTVHPAGAKLPPQPKPLPPIPSAAAKSATQKRKVKPSATKGKGKRTAV